MAYSDVDDDVKPILQVDASNTTYDTELAACVASADAIIDSILLREGLTVPVSVPANVKDASAHLASWLFRRRRDPTGAEAFWEEANRILQVYIDSAAEPAFRAVSA